MPLHDRPEPFAGLAHGIVHALAEFRFYLPRLGPHAFANRRAPHHESPQTTLPANVRVSRPAELHHQRLAEPSVRLSPHSAPIRQTCRSYGLSVARIEVLLFPVASVMRPPDPTPSLQPHYEPSSLLRVGPPQCSASVRSPRGCGRLGSPLISERLFLQFRATACIRFTPSLRRSPSAPSSGPRGLVLGRLYALGFDDTYLLNDASSKGSLSFVSRMLTCTGLYPRYSSNAHHHGSLPQQLGPVWDLLLKADPEGPSLISCAACHPHG